VGHVVEAGPSVSQWAVGDRVATMHRDACGECAACMRGATSHCESAAFVFGLLANGGYSTTLVAPERALFAVPSEMPAAHAAIMHCTFGTAYRNLVTAGGLTAGERVVITGANGGVGAAAVQIAARMGADVVAVVRRAGFESFLTALGAARVVVAPDNRFHKKAETRDADLVLDCVGADTFNSSLRCLKVGGRLAVVGNIREARVELNLGYVIVKGLTILSAGGATPADMAGVFALNAEAPLAVSIDAVLPLARAEEAQQRVREGGLRGRIVLSMEQEETP
jgi:D-arabinose 1-dehydrogenase-like Zn-dependent alcohol dehydrogenase